MWTEDSWTQPGLKSPRTKTGETNEHYVNCTGRKDIKHEDRRIYRTKNMDAISNQSVRS